MIQGKHFLCLPCTIRMSWSAEISQEDCDTIKHMNLDMGHLADDVAAVSHMAPPKEEGFDISHEGGEHELFDDLMDGLAQSNG